MRGVSSAICRIDASPISLHGPVNEGKNITVEWLTLCYPQCVQNGRRRACDASYARPF